MRCDFDDSIPERLKEGSVFGKCSQKLSEMYDQRQFFNQFLLLYPLAQVVNCCRLSGDQLGFMSCYLKFVINND